MIDLGKKDIIGVHVDVIGYDDAVARIVRSAQQRMTLGVSALAVHGLMEGAFDPERWSWFLRPLDGSPKVEAGTVSCFC